MADIPGWAWLITGFFMVGVAAVIGGLGPFILIGCGFIAWGTFKAARDYMLKGQKPKLRPWEQDAIHKGHLPPATSGAGHGGQTNIYEPVTGIRAMEMHDELREHAPAHEGRHADRHDADTAWRHSIEQRSGASPNRQNVRAIPCPTCKTQVWSNAHFCHFCGAQLKHPGR